MEIVGVLIGLLSIPLTVVGFILLIRQIRKTQRIQKRTALIGMFFSILMLVVNLLFLNSALVSLWQPFFLILGGGFGLAWGLTTKLMIREEDIVAKRSIAYILFWAVSLAITQVLAAFARNSVVAFGLGGMFFSAGSSLGTNLNLLTRTLLKERKLKKK